MSNLEKDVERLKGQIESYQNAQRILDHRYKLLWNDMRKAIDEKAWAEHQVEFLTRDNIELGKETKRLNSLVWELRDKIKSMYSKTDVPSPSS